MDFYDVVTTRCSMRMYDRNKAIPDDVLRRILNAGRVAPSAMNLQPWRFHVVQSQEMLQKIYSCYARPWIQNVPCFVIVSGSRDDAWVRRKDGYNSIETDLTIVMDHLVLAATCEGLGTCWIAAFDPDMLRQAIRLKPNEEVFAMTTLGYAPPDATHYPTTRKSLDEITEFL